MGHAQSLGVLRIARYSVDHVNGVHFKSYWPGVSSDDMVVHAVNRDLRRASFDRCYGISSELPRYGMKILTVVFAQFGLSVVVLAFSVIQDVVPSVQALCGEVDAHGGGLQTEEGKAAGTRISGWMGDERLDQKMVEDIKVFWKDPGTQKAYENRSEFQLDESCAYFINQVDQVIYSESA